MMKRITPLKLISLVLAFCMSNYVLWSVAIVFGSSHNPGAIESKNARKSKPWVTIQLKPVSGEFEMPTYLTGANDGSGRLFVVEKVGRIKTIKEGRLVAEPFLDISSRVNSRATERGLFSVAFHPNYKQNGRFFVNYTNRNGNTVVSEFIVSDNPDKADESSERIILQVEQPAPNHNGGQLQFGPDGYLYIGMGDGGGAGDPSRNAQNKETLLGKLLRIDVDKKRGYSIPNSNPFFGKQGIRPEIWAYGLRNPWRFSFDRSTGDLYIADVGQSKWESVYFQAANSKGGQNYGWNLMEGLHPFRLPSGFDTSGLTPPILEYGHDQGCSITGGYVYRGKSYPSISGTYIFSDFCSGTIWGLKNASDKNWEWAELSSTPYSISSFGEDENGEIYVVDYKGGRIYQIVGSPFFLQNTLKGIEDLRVKLAVCSEYSSVVLQLSSDRKVDRIPK